jgi:hypothetical protein
LHDLLAHDLFLGLESRAEARSIASCAIFSPSSTCWLSQSENASWAAPSTKAAA